MKVTFPHMGNLWIVIKTILEDLGLEVVVPPFPNRRGLDAGVRNSPEFACFPLKLNIGDFLGAIDRGADVIVMGGGIGPCRFGHYAQVQSQVLRDLGHDIDMVILEPPQGHLPELLDKIRYLTGHKPLLRVWRAIRHGFEKLKALDELDQTLAWARPREARPGAASRRHKVAVSAVAGADGVARTRRILEEGIRRIEDTTAGTAGVEIGRKTRPLQVGIVGEVFMIAEPFANQEVERRLGEMGVETARALYLSDWVRTHLLPKIVQPARARRARETSEAARPYLRHFVGGEGLDSVGEAILFDRRGFDGVIQIAPFTCMPEIVAASLLPEVGRDLALPVLSLFLDEHTGEAGLTTRLEAFVDLLARRRLAGAKQAW